jgi:UDP-2-acetamido-3-amino-2,3-dideoxy-glucuronate N-acetyltransferase
MNGYYAHSTTVIDPGASIGNGTKVWHFTHIMPNANIGENCILGQNVFIDNNTFIGNNVKIQNNVSVYNGVSLANNVFIGPSVVFTNVTNPRSFVERKSEFKPTTVQEGASIGANATIVCGLTIGKYAFIGAGAVVTKNVLPFAVMAGNPALQIGWISKEGHKLSFTNGKAFCKEEGLYYQLINGLVQMIEN